MRIDDRTAEITPQMLEELEQRGNMIIKVVKQMVLQLLGDNYTPVLILARDGDPKALAIMAEIGPYEDLIDILKNASDRAGAGEMVNTNNAPQNKGH